MPTDLSLETWGVLITFVGALATGMSYIIQRFGVGNQALKIAVANQEQRNQDYEQLTQKNASLQAELHAAELKQAEYRGFAEARMDTLETTNTQRKHEVDTLREKMKQMEADSAQTEKRLSDEVSELRAQIGQIQARLEAAEREKEALEAQKASLEKEREAQDDTLEALRSDMEAMRVDFETRTSALEAKYEERIAELEAEIRKKEATISKLQKELEQAHEETDAGVATVVDTGGNVAADGSVGAAGAGTGGDAGGADANAGDGGSDAGGDAASDTE